MRKKPNIKTLKKNFAKVHEAFDNMECGSFYCWADEKNKCPVFRECKMLDICLLAIKERLDE